MGGNAHRMTAPRPRRHPRALSSGEALIAPGCSRRPQTSEWLARGLRLVVYRFSDGIPGSPPTPP